MIQTVSDELIHSAWNDGLCIPSFNVPYLPMVEPVVCALRDSETFGFIAVARLEWVKFEAKGISAVYEEYLKFKDERFTRLHLDHVPVIDEDGLRVGYRSIVAEAIVIGYQSVMVDGSRLPLEENIAATREIVELAHAAGVPVEGELGAVLGHEAAPLLPYEDLFSTGKGFTDPEDARRFVQETGVDWLSVAIGNIHGAISGAARSGQKIQARLHQGRLLQIRDAARVPLVLHGGSGIERSCLPEAFRNGIAKINVGTAIRQPYEAARPVSVKAAQQAVYDTTLRVICEELGLAGSARRIKPQLSSEIKEGLC